jgi:hypothetical protein
LLSLGLHELFIDGSFEEVIEGYIQLHKCQHELGQDLNRLLI